jgi:uncharacterized protein YkwD
MSTMRRFTSLLVAFVFATPLAAAELRPGHVEITPDTVLSEMNAYRAQFNLPPLQLDKRLQSAADDRMRDMEELAYWSHNSPDGRSPFMWLRMRNYPYQFAGENLATGFETCEVLVSSWMESKGHRDNILSADYTECGIAIIDGSTTRRSVGKSIVVLFGRQRAQDIIVVTISTSRCHASIPPVRFFTFAKPCSCRKCCTCALRPPIRQ